MKIVKQTPLTPAATELIGKATSDEVGVGSIFIRNFTYGINLCRIAKIEECQDHDKTPFLRIHYETAQDWEGMEWRSYGTDRAEHFFNDETYLIKPKAGQSIVDAIAEAHKAAIAMIENKDFTAISADEEEIKPTERVSTGSKEHLTVMEAEMKNKRNIVGILQSFVGYEMRKRQQELDEVKKHLGGILDVFNKKIKKIQRVISMIELYLGINEEIVQISEGEKALATAPINFRQQLLFMDEEVGEAKDGGWDYQNIEGFDKWLVENERFKKIVPEEKCVVAFRVRRTSKHYSDNAFEQAIKNAKNGMTYLLIRNGNCLYRIWAEINIGKRLFPLRKEFEDILTQISNRKQKYLTDREVEALETEMSEYQKRAFMLQGLIDRTEVFHPLVKPVSMFKMEEADGLINFIYDDEAALPNGRLPFWQWVKKINKGIKRGSRIVHSGQYSSEGRFTSNKDYKDRLFYYCSDFNAPRLPSAGVYEVHEKFEETTDELPHYYIDKMEREGLLLEKGKEKLEHYHKGYETHETNNYLPDSKSTEIKTWKKDGREYLETYKCKFLKRIFYIKYNPKDTVYGSWGDYDPYERKKSIGWQFDLRYDDFIFNYDQISIEDIDFYLDSRADRKHYANMMPILRTWKKHRLEEMKWEKEFVEFIWRRAQEKNLVCKMGVDFNKLIWSAIDWWKHKNIWKRPITKDDALALRMIERRIFSKESLKKNFVKNLA